MTSLTRDSPPQISFLTKNRHKSTFWSKIITYENLKIMQALIRHANEMKKYNINENLWYQISITAVL